MPPRKGLGKGLDNLIPRGNSDPAAVVKKPAGEKIVEKEVVKEVEVIKEVEVVKEVVKNEPLMVKTMLVEPNREQPRKQFDEEALAELAGSLQQYGMIQPIIVQKKGDFYEIIAGERRWRAAQLAGLSEVPVVVKEYADDDVLEIALIENIQRQDLNPIEEALAYKRLLEEYKLTQEEVADRVSKSRTAVTNSMRLLKLCDQVQEYLINGKLSGGHARALVTIESEEEQVKVADIIIKKGLSVRETEKMVKELMNPKPTKPLKEREIYNDQFVYDEMEEQLRRAVGSKVRIQRKEKEKGVIEIEYYSIEELERLALLLQGK